jgi:hypothetical protein
MTLVFSSGALITLGQAQLGQIVAALQHHRAPDYVTVALLAITFVIVGGMDLTLLNSAVELRDGRLRGLDARTDPELRAARTRVWLVSLIESATFMSVAYQLDQPPALTRNLVGCLVAWAFIVARALVAPVCAMYLATLGKRVVARRELYANLLLSIGGTIQEILEQLQFGADIRLIRPLWEMQRLVDRASRAKDDDEMDGYDERLLAALEELCARRDRLDGIHLDGVTDDRTEKQGQRGETVVSKRRPVVAPGGSEGSGDSEDSGDRQGEPLEDWDLVPAMPTTRYSPRRIDARLEATR